MELRYNFHPWVEGPETSHIVWKRQDGLAGLIGGYAYYYGTTTNVGTPSIIYAGRCYQTVTTIVDGESTDVFQCYDLRTGEVYWEIYPLPTVTTTSMFGPMTSSVIPDIVAYVPPGPGSVPGAVAQNTYLLNCWQ